MEQTPFCGLNICSPTDVPSALKLASDHGFEYVSIPLAHPRFKREFTAEWKDRPGPFTRPDLVLRSNEWSSLIAGRISPYICFESEILNSQGKFALEQELNYGSHLDVPAIIVPLRNSECFNLARTVNLHLLGLKSYQIWVEVPLISYEKNASEWRSDVNEDDLQECTWEWWNNFHTMCNLSGRLGVILEITKFVPSEKELQRWMGEPVRCLIISTSIFLTNKKGYPILPKVVQNFIKSLVPSNIQVIIKGNDHHKGLDCYRQYVMHLWKKCTIGIISCEYFQEGNAERNLEKENLSNSITSQYFLELYHKDVSQMFEFCEKNSVKYRQYTNAVHQAILDRINREDKGLNVMIVGAGKVPLVLAVYGMAAKYGKTVKIYCLERDPNEIVILQAYQDEYWHDAVEIISQDIRYLNFPQVIDIVVSMSLGSFGDDELLPEISDITQKFLRSGGVSIPESYTSYICPVQAANFYSDMRDRKNDSDYETPHFINPKLTYKISSIKSLFSFQHPNFGEHGDNFRYKKLSFEVEQKCILHGFFGFFEAVLYKDITLCVLPNSSTPGINNWNPIFFPLQEPVQLTAADELLVHFWRIVGKTKVWYEWSVTKPVSKPIHNPNGRFSSMVFEYWFGKDM